MFKLYYVKLEGNDFPVLRAASFQKGHGIRSVFGSVRLTVLTLLKSREKVVKKNVSKLGSFK